MSRGEITHCDSAAVIFTSNWKLWQSLCQTLPDGEQELFSAPSIFDTFFSEDWNEEAAYKLVMCLALFLEMSKGYICSYMQQSEAISIWHFLVIVLLAFW